MNKTVTAVANSWKTTILAILLFGDALGHAAMALLDSDPATVPDWNLVVALAVAAAGLAFARDADKSSQDAGIRK